MNILILSWRGPKHPNAGGGEISTHQHAKGWVDADHNVTLFTSAYLDCKFTETIDGIKIIRRGSQVFGVHLEAFKWYLSEDHEKFDLVVDQFHGIPFFTPLYVKEKKLAFIHEVTKEVWKLNPWHWPFNLIPSLLGTFFEPLIFRLFYKKFPFMTVSQSTKKDLVVWGIPSENINVIQNGFNKAKSGHKYSKEEKKTIIYLGSLSKDKGIEDALRCFSILSRQDSNMQFWIAGRGDPVCLKFLKLLTRRLGISSKIKFYGYVSENKKYELLARAHILVNPSVREGWGLVVIEAASVGTPTVAYDVAGLRDSIMNGKTGILCEAKVESLALNIANLLKNYKEYDKISHHAVSWSGNFSWLKSQKMSLDLIRKLIG